MTSDEDGVHLSWKAPLWSGSADLEGYVVYRSVEGGDREPIAVLGASATAHSDLAPVPGAVYAVTAFNVHGESLAASPGPYPHCWPVEGLTVDIKCFFPLPPPWFVGGNIQLQGPL